MSRADDLAASGGWTLRRQVLIIAVTVLTLIALTLTLIDQVGDARGAVRVRNALIAWQGSPADFSWIPSARPESFPVDTGPAPPLFTDAIASLQLETRGLAAGLKVARHLGAVQPRGGAIQRSTTDTYQQMRSTGGGYCADFTQVFLGLAAAAGLPAREWGIAFDGFGGDGHAVTEVFDAGLGKWIMIDSFYSFYARDAATGVPLSVLEFRQALRAEAPLQAMAIERIVPAAFGFKTDARLVEYFQRGIDQFYLWWGSNVFEYDSNPFVGMAERISRSGAQAAAIMLGVHPTIAIAPTENNAGLIGQLRELRTRVVALLAAIALLGTALLVEIWLVFRRVRRGRLAGVRRDPG